MNKEKREVGYYNLLAKEEIDVMIVRMQVKLLAEISELITKDSKLSSGLPAGKIRYRKSGV